MIFLLVVIINNLTYLNDTDTLSPYIWPFLTAFLVITFLNNKDFIKSFPKKKRDNSAFPLACVIRMRFVVLIAWNSRLHSLVIVISHKELPLKFLVQLVLYAQGSSPGTWSNSAQPSQSPPPARQVSKEQNDGKAWIVVVLPSESSTRVLVAGPTPSTTSPRGGCWDLQECEVVLAPPGRWLRHLLPSADNAQP